MSDPSVASSSCRPRWVAAAAASLLWLCAAPTFTHAQSAAATRARQSEAVRKLNAGDPEAVRTGVQTLRELGDAASQKALVTRLQVGLPPALVVTVLDALVAMKARRALPVITELSQHRRALVRSRALTALGALEARGARATQTLLIAALEDPSSEVTAAAATALEKVGTKVALPGLFAAYDRGVTSALPAIAELAGRESIGELVARMPQGVVEPLEPALDKLLDGSKLSTTDQVELARKLTGLGTPSARRYLLKWLDRIKLSGHARVKGELFQALKALDAAAQAKPQATPTVAAKGAKP
jgi:HEAT repeat protein